MRAADYDLTGQTIWPAAQMLADYLADHLDILAGCDHACELGAGLGLVGLFAAQACPVTLTDHNEIVMRVLSKNSLLSQSSHSIRFTTLSNAASHSTATKYTQVLYVMCALAPCRCLRMDWNSQEDIATVKAASPRTQVHGLVVTSSAPASLCLSLCHSLVRLCRALAGSPQADTGLLTCRGMTLCLGLMSATA